jgi:chromosome segregation ATPase
MQLKTIIIFVVCVAAGVAVLLLLGYLGVQPFTVIYDTAAGYMGGFDVGAVASNPASIVTMAAPALAIGGAALSKISSLKQKATTEVATAKATVGDLSNTLSTTKDQLGSATSSLEVANAKVASLEAAAKTFPDQITALQKEKDNLTVQLQALNNIQAKATVLAENKEVVRTIIK